MALSMPNQGETMMLEMLVGKTAVQNLKLLLYQSNTTPAETDTEATYTVATFTGYADFTFTAASWTTTGADPSHADYAQQTFTSTAGSQNQSIYGYYIIQVTSLKLLWSERFSDGPYVIVNNGDNIKITPRIEAS